MKVKSTKSALLMSFTSLLLCFAMLIGCTFAWFTDSVTSGVNKIVAGNLDIEVQYTKDNGTTWANLQDSQNLFGTDKWEPGHTEFVTLKIENKGTLALNYKMMVSPVTEKGGVNVAGERFKLSDYLVFSTTAPSDTQKTYEKTDEGRAAARTDAGAAQTLSQDSLTKSGTMAAKTSDATPTQYVTLVVYMPETVGNEANYKSGTAAPEIELGITVVATQLGGVDIAEKDIFDNDYDTNAKTNASEYVVGPSYNYFPQVVKTVAVTKGDDNKVSTAASIDVKEGEGESEQTLASVTVPVGVQLEAGTSELTLKVTPQAPTPDTVTGTGLAVEVADANREIANFDVKIEGVAAENTKPITVNVFVGKGLSNVKIYHNGELMTGTTYVADTGIATFQTPTFSDYTIAYDVVCARIGEKTYGSLELAVAAAQSGETIVLLKDLDTGAGASYDGHTYGIVVAKADRAFTIDGDGHEITGTAKYILGVDQCDKAVTIKNLTVTGSGGANTAAINLTGCSNVTLENITASGAKTGVIVNNTVATIKGASNIPTCNGWTQAVNVDAGGTGNPQGPKLTVEAGTIGVIKCENSGSLFVNGGNVEKIEKAGDATGTISISGGTFSEEPDAKFVAEGKEVVDNENGTWKVGEPLPEAKIGDTEYATLDLAFATAQSGDTIEITKAGTYALSNKTVPTGTTIVGDEGVVLTVKKAAKANQPCVGANNVTFRNVAFDFTEGTSYAAIGTTASTVSFDTCTFTGLVNTYGYDTFTNCTFNNTGDNYNAHVYAYKSTFTNCHFYGEVKNVYVYTDGYNAEAEFTGCDFHMSTATPDKSAIMLNASNGAGVYTVKITNCTIEGGMNKTTAENVAGNTNYQGIYGLKHKNGNGGAQLVAGSVTLDGEVVYQTPAN